MPFRFAIPKQVAHLFREMVGNQVEDGRCKMDDGESEMEHVVPRRFMTFDLRPSTLPSPIRVSLPARCFASDTASLLARPLLRSRYGRSHPFPVRALAGFLSALLFFTSSPVALAITMAEVRSGVVPGQSGGRGSASNLQNAGAASAALTASLARQSIRRSDTAVGAMRAMQQNAAAAARAAARTGNPILPNGQTVNGSAVIPNGLAVNWLHPHDGFDGNGKPLTTSWKGASINMAKTTSAGSSGDHNIEITQNAQNAYLYWKDFNVGPRTTINFDQSKGGADAGKWIAFNKITGNASPSSVYGKIQAQGQVYILNQNGIMFHNGSEVNVHALVASTLPINPYFAGDPMQGIEGRGLLNNTDYQFLFSALKLSSSQNYPESWDPGNGTPIAASAIGGLKVEKGASISTAKPNGTGGRVMLVGPSVQNDGTISTPDGQTILAAGLQVGVNAHPSSDPSLRGLDVHIGRVVDDADRTAGKSFSTDQSGTRVGTVVNNGLIEMPRGHAAMVGRDLTQNGIIDSSTSVTLNGRVDLQAAYNAVVPVSTGFSPYWYDQTLPGGTTGTILLGSSGVIRILPETTSSETLPGTKVSLSSIIAMMGNSVRAERGSIVLAPGAKPVTGEANENIYYDMTRPARLSTGDSSSVSARLDSGISITGGNWYRPANQQFGMFVTGAVGTSAEGKITLDPGSLISVAGSTGTEIDGARNFQTIELRGPELADFPLQRESVFRGKKITIDTRITGTYDGREWVGTPLGNAAGYVSLIGKTAGELTADGGSIALRAGDRVDVGSGAVLDVSGGWVRFSETTYATTKLLFNGLPIDISKATPNMVYDRVVENAGSMTEIPYYEGGSGGSLTIQAPMMTLEGTMRGGVVTGARQLRPVSGDIHLPDPASLKLSILQSRIYSGASLVPDSPYAPQLAIGSAGSSSSGVINQIRLNPGVFGSGGFGHLSVLNHDGSILLPKGVSLDLGPAGSVNLSASSLAIDGTVSAPGGRISLSAYNVSYDDLILLDAANSSRFEAYDSSGIIRIGSSSILSTRGLVANDFTDRSLAGTVMLDGGSVSISALDVGIERGSLIDVSAGAWVRSDSVRSAKLTEAVRATQVQSFASASVGSGVSVGAGGSILIEGGQDLEVKTIRDGAITIAGQFRGFGGVGSRSGELSINAPAIQIGGLTGDARILKLSPSFFSTGGFSNFNLKGIGFEAGSGSADEEIPGIRVASGAVINPWVRNVLYLPTTGFSEHQMSSGMSPAVNLKLIAQGLVDPKGATSPGYVVRGKVAIDKGAVINLSPSIALPVSTSTTPVATTGSLSVEGKLINLEGTLSVPGGAISIKGAERFPENLTSDPDMAYATVQIGSGARISASGSALFMSDPLGLGRRLGAVLEGGNISLEGNLQLKDGSVLDVSGTAANRFVASGLSRADGGDLMVQSSGGSITLSGGQMLESQGTLLGRAGGASALGGTLSVSSGRFYNLNNSAEQIADPRDVNLIVAQDLKGLGARIEADRNAKISSKGYFAADSANTGGFENLTLAGNVEFSGPVSITLPGNLRVASGGTIRADSLVTLKAGHAALGSSMVGARTPGDTKLSKAFGGDSDPYVGPSGGNGFLQVEARLIELGNLLLANFSSASFLAPGGIIRGDGAVNIAGNLILRAAQIHPVTASRMTFAAYDPAQGKGSILVEQSGGPLSLPLSAGGELSLYASTITQNGTLLSPFGTINLGWDGTGASPRDPVSGAGIRDGVSVPVTETLTLGSSGKTSISAIDPLSGTGVAIPYGIIINGTQWIDPTGVDIASVGLPSKGVNLSALSVNTLGGSSIDLRGGGELAAFQWISGLKGTRDIAAPSSGSYAILPSFGSEFIPVANFADRSRTGGDPGYLSTSLAIGDRITLAGGSGLPAGTYTLLPARYALFPGGFLITPTGMAQERNPASWQMPDGTAMVSGIRYNDTRGGRPVQDITEIYKITSPSLLGQSADYRLLKASESLPKTPLASPVTDAGRLVIKSTGAMNLLGGVQGAGRSGGRGSSIDISGSKDFQIGGNATAGTIALDAAALSSWNAGSLLIGGIRSITSTGISVTPGTSKVIVDNAGAPLTAADLILVAKDGIIFKDNAVISSTGSGAAPGIDIKGNGAVVRTSADRSATVTRTESDKGATVTGYEIGNGARINGGSIILESSGLGFISDSADLSADAYGIVAGSIAVGLDGTKREGVLNLVGTTLEKLSSAKKVDLKSYGSMEFLGGGVFGSDATESISLNAGAILGTGMGDGILSLNAGTILLGNSEGASRAPMEAKADDGSPLTPSGTLELNARTILIGENDLSLDGFSYVSLNASGVLAGSGKGGLHAGTTPMTYTTIAGDSLETLAETYGVTTEVMAALNRDVLSGQDLQALSEGLPILISQTTHLFITTPFVTGIQGAKTTIASSGVMSLMAPDPEYVTQSSVTPGLGSKLTLQGSSLSINTSIMLPSGELAARATAGDLLIGTAGVASLNVGGASKTINSVTQFTDAGSMEFSSAGGDVIVGQQAKLMLNAAAKGSAGSLAILTPSLADTASGREAGRLVLEDGALIQALAGSGGEGGSLKLDLGELASTSELGFGRTEEGEVIGISDAGFTKSMDLRVRTGDLAIDNYLVNRNVTVTTDNGSITVTPDGVIDASGKTGGNIALQASGSVILMPNSALTVRGDTYDNAGKGGSVFLSAGAAVERSEEDGNTYLDINRDAVLDLQTASSIDLGVTAPQTRRDQFEGTLHLRAPITADLSDIQIGSFDATITGASSIAVEGYRAYDLSGSSGEITGDLRSTIAADASAFFGASGGNSDAATAILSRLTANQETAIRDILNLAPGVEIINRSGNLLLNTDWDLSSFRTGENKASGFLSLRSSGDIRFEGALSDGFQNATYTANLIALNNALPQNFQSWSYGIGAGADLASASSETSLRGGAGSVWIGKTSLTGNVVIPANEQGKAQTAEAIQGFFQVIRTGTGDIRVSSADSIRLMNQFATIYTAGAPDADQNLNGSFDDPRLANSSGRLNANSTVLGSSQQSQFVPLYSYGGGNISLKAGANVEHLQPDPDSPGGFAADSSRQLPVNWLSRRSEIAPEGTWNSINLRGETEALSTTWWVNFPSFFQGIGTLGGGNITMLAGGNISNVDASLPTQGRMTGRDGMRLLTPGESTLVETGGGDLLLRAGGNLDAGVYYTERGNGVIMASGDIVSNPTRDVYGDYLHSIVKKDPSFRSPERQESLKDAILPTSFFLGKGSLSVTAGGDALLGPVGNVFLLPPGINNDLRYKTYFSTYGQDASFAATALAGNLTLRTKILNDSAYSTWLYHSGMGNAETAHPKPGVYQPWLLIAEKDPLDAQFRILPQMASLLPGTMNLASLSGDINLQGDLTLSPAPQGTLNMLAAASIRGVSRQIPGTVWSGSVINVSDASPESIPSLMAPRSQPVLPSGLANLQTDTTYLGAVGAALTETASYTGINAILQGKVARHDQTLLHRNNPEPIRITAGTGSLSGVELFAPTKTEIKVGGDLYDVAIAIQHLSRSDVSIISAGGEMRLYDANNPDLLAAILDLKSLPPEYARPQPRSGDIQISGPGTLQVIAGGNIDLGTGDVRSDGTGVGITSIGNARNPALPFEGASLITVAGASLPGSLAAAGLDEDGLFGKVSAMRGAGDYFKELKNMVLGNWESSISSKLADIQSVRELQDDPSLTADEKSRLALSLFYIVLRESGRDFNDIGSPTYRTYKNGQDAIAAYLPGEQQGSIVLNSRDIRTKSGGAISMLAPNGGITLSPFAVSQSLTPPGIVTESGGPVNIYTKGNVDIGIGRIFTLRGGDITIWSNLGNIAAGSSAKTVATAPPTRVLLDPQSGDVQTDLAGLATGGGIGVLAAVAGVPAGNVDLIAPIGFIDAGDAGIRSTGNLNLAAKEILNADNILVGGIAVGAPPAAPPAAAPAAAPPASAPPAGANSAAAANNNTADTASRNNAAAGQGDQAPSIFSIDILGYGGGDGGEDDENKAASLQSGPAQASL
jgi:filamentous hemagglutinin family protein